MKRLLLNIFILIFVSACASSKSMPTATQAPTERLQPTSTPNVISEPTNVPTHALTPLPEPVEYYHGFSGDLAQNTLVTDAQIDQIIAYAKTQPSLLPSNAEPTQYHRLLRETSLVYEVLLTTDNVLASIKTADPDGTQHNGLIIEVKNKNGTTSHLKLIFAGKEDRGYPSVDRMYGDGIASLSGIEHDFFVGIEVSNTGAHKDLPITKYMTPELQALMEEFSNTGNIPPDLEELYLPVVAVFH